MQFAVICDSATEALKVQEDLRSELNAKGLLRLGFFKNKTWKNLDDMWCDQIAGKYWVVLPEIK